MEFIGALREALTGMSGASYWTWALAVAAGFYSLVRFADAHVGEDAKAALSLWLQGDYAETWSAQFCRLFDGVFTENHLGWRCVLRSAAFSLVSVLALYVLLDRVLGVLDFRAGGRLELWQALAIGAAVNLVPDYLSLYQTRWVLGRFRTVRSVVGQVGVLALDLVVTGAIIFAGINAYQLIRGEGVVPLPEMLFLFSVYAVFFYSTFATSAWAWVYCLSSWVMRGFLALGLNRVLDVRAQPVAQLALIVFVLSFAGLMAARPALQMGEDGRAALDDRLCRMFPVVCDNVAPLTADEELQLEYLALACRGGVDETCMDTALRLYGVDDAEAAALWRRACDGGDAGGCTNLGVLHERGRGVAQSDTEAARLYRQGCDGGNAAGCTNLGILHQNGRGVAQSDTEAARLYRQGCDGGDAGGCTNLGVLHHTGRGVAQTDTEAARLFRQGCDGGDPGGCSNLGILHRNGRGVAQSDTEAARLYRQGCDGGDAAGCTNLGVLYRNGRGVAQSDAEAARLYRMGCEGGNAEGCSNLGVLYWNGRGVAQSDAEAARLYRMGCDGGDAGGCTNLGVLHHTGRGVAQTDTEAARLFRQGCDGGDPGGCSNLAFLHVSGRGVAQSATDAARLSSMGCDGGDAGGCTILGVLVESGAGVPSDPARAVELFRQGCAGGNEAACRALDLRGQPRP